MTHLKIIGVMNIKDKKIREQITRNIITGVKMMVAKSEDPVTEIDIRKEVKRLYGMLSAGYFKNNK